MSVSGFADLNVDTGSPNRWVAEPQLNVRIDRTFHLVLEGRYNGYEDANPDADGFGVAVGVKINN